MRCRFRTENNRGQKRLFNDLLLKKSDTHQNESVFQIVLAER